MRETWIAVVICLVLASSLRGGPSEVRSLDRLAYALTGARVIVAPGRVIENGVVVRGGVIDAVGPILASEAGQYAFSDGSNASFARNVLAAWLDGRSLDLTDKQKRLYERYRNRPK